MKTFYPITLSLIAFAMLGGVVSAQTTSEPTTSQLQQQIQQLQQQIQMLQDQVDSNQSEDENEQEDGEESESENENEDTASSSDALLEQAAVQARIARQLDQGDRGPDVRKLQELLASNSEIYPEGLVTGYYGELTSKAVSRLQERVGLPSVGRVGPRTLEQINSLLTGGAGQLGMTPPGLLQAPGLDSLRGDVSKTSSTSNSATTTSGDQEVNAQNDEELLEADSQLLQEKLGSQLRGVIMSSGNAGMGPGISSYQTDDGNTAYGVLIRTGSPQALENAGLSLNSVSGSVVTARLTRAEIITAAKLDSVDYIEADGQARPM